MPLTVAELRRLLDEQDPNSEVLLAVNGYEPAEIRPDLLEVEGFVFLRLALGSEIVELLSECDILR